MASEQFRGLKETSMERAMGLIEHVVKYGKAHLKYSGSDLTLLEYLCLDVFVVIFLAVSVSLLIIVPGIYAFFKRFVVPFFRIICRTRPMSFVGEIISVIWYRLYRDVCSNFRDNIQLYIFFVVLFISIFVYS